MNKMIKDIRHEARKIAKEKTKLFHDVFVSFFRAKFLISANNNSSSNSIIWIK